MNKIYLKQLTRRTEMSRNITLKALFLTKLICLVLFMVPDYKVLSQNLVSKDTAMALEVIEQNNSIESQFKKLHQAQIIFEDQPKEALLLVEGVLVYTIEQEKGLGHKVNLDILKGEAYQILGDFNFQNGIYDQASINYLEAYSLFKNNGEQHIPNKLVKHIALSYRYNKAYKKSLEFYLDFESKALDQKQFKEVISAKNNIGELYYILNKVSLAESYHMEALDVSIKHHLNSGIQESSYALEQLSFKIKKNEEGSAFKSKTQSITNAFNNKNLENREYEPLEGDKKLQGQTISSILESENLKKRQSELEKLQVPTKEFTEEYNRKNEINRDILRLKEYIFLVKNKNNYPELSKALFRLYKLYQKNGKPNLALESYKAYRAVEDSLNVQPRDLPNIEPNFSEELKLVQSKLSYLEKEKNLDIKTIEVLKKQQALDRESIKREKEISILLTVGVCLLFIVSILFIRLNRSRKRANELLRLKGLQAQMNPHFIFNTLNSVNNFISKNDERSANRYISDFSKLMRHVLELAQEDLISLEQELEMLSLYLKLEHLRFKDKFEYIIEVDSALENQEIAIPPMLIQPFIENAIWHGLRYINENGKLVVKFSNYPKYCLISIDDNGIGREKSAELKTKNQKSHNSTALKNIESRLSYIKKIYKKKFELDIIDKPSGQGTQVNIKLFK